MKIITTSKCTLIATTPNGNKKQEDRVSNVKVGNTVVIEKNRFNKNKDTQEEGKLQKGTKARVKKINCDQRTVSQNGTGVVLQIQLDLLVETQEGKQFYVTSTDVKKI